MEILRRGIMNDEVKAVLRAFIKRVIWRETLFTPRKYRVDSLSLMFWVFFFDKLFDLNENNRTKYSTCFTQLNVKCLLKTFDGHSTHLIF